MTPQLPFLPCLDPHFHWDVDIVDAQTQGDPQEKDLLILPIPNPLKVGREVELHLPLENKL